MKLISESKKEVRIQITLSGDEADELKALMQNPLHLNKPEPELLEKFRIEFFNRLREELDSY